MSDEQQPGSGGAAHEGGDGDGAGQRSRRRRRPRRRPKTGGQQPVGAPESAASSQQQSAPQPQAARDPQPRSGEPGEGRRRRSPRGRGGRSRRGGSGDAAPSSEAQGASPAAVEQATDGEAKSRRSRRRRRRPTAEQPRPGAEQSRPNAEQPRPSAEQPRQRTGAITGPPAPSSAKRRRSAGRSLTAAPRPEAVKAGPARPETALSFPDEDGWGIGEEAAISPAGGESAADNAGTSARPELSLLEEPEIQLDPDGADEFLELEQDAPRCKGCLANIVGVRLREGTKVFPFDAGSMQLATGEQIVVESELGLAIGEVAQPPQPLLTCEPARPVHRRVDQNDLRQQARNLLREREAFEYCQQRIAHRRLPMKLIRVEYVHGGNKAIFFFAAENRIDFRDLVKDLAQRLHTRIVMRQVGVRDESRMTGGIGSCGCELCCSTWLPKFEPVSIRMAKDQGLVLNPQKVSGQCGRLKCCLTYEQHQYQEVRKQLPKPGRRVTTPDGDGRVQELDVLRRLVRVSLGDGSMQTYPADQVKPVAAQGNAPRPAGSAADE